jgi:DNA (cytosine-5)-methyltransferase 1
LDWKADVATHTQLNCIHLCSGYGGFELGFKLAGINARTVAHVERDTYAAATLVARMAETHLDQAPIWDDLTTFNGSAWRGRVDCITAGFPCQPFSAAGKQLGIEDDRWIWPAIKRIILDVGPGFVFLENVPQLVRGGLAFVLSDLAELGFNAEWGLHSAAEVGAPHKRDRFWLLAHSTSNQPRQLGNTKGSKPNKERDPIVRGDTAPDGLRQQQQPDVGNASGTRRSEITRSVPSQQDQTIRRRQGTSDHIIDSSGETVANTQSERSVSGTGDVRPQIVDPWRLSETVAHTTSSGRAVFQRDDREDSNQAADSRPSGDAGRSNTHSPWPPTRDGNWDEYINQGGPKPALRRTTDGPTEGLADALHLGGNGLVPAVAAAAFIELLNRHQQ